MKILVASDSFKGTLTSLQVGRILQEVLCHEHEVDVIPISDGGEGFLESQENAFKAASDSAQTQDPLGRTINGHYLLTPDQIGILETATYSGLTLLRPDEANPLLTHTYGLGLMIKRLLEKGAKEIFIGLGGSATNDGGTGMLQALGVRFFNSAGIEIKQSGGQILDQINEIDLSKLHKAVEDTTFYGVCDVENPLLGPNGATHVYGPQKGADHQTLDYLEKGMVHFASTTAKKLNKDYAADSGSGAAGGLGFALKAFLKAELISGIEATMAAQKLETRVKNYDLLITGEGKLDEQTLAGKAPTGILKLGLSYKKKVVCICGSMDIQVPTGFEKIFSIVPDHATQEESLTKPEESLRKLTRQEIFKWLKEV